MSAPSRDIAATQPRQRHCSRLTIVDVDDRLPIANRFRQRARRSMVKAMTTVADCAMEPGESR